MTGALAFAIIAANIAGLIIGALYALVCVTRGGE
jgi:tetrahydromethanopterin S-methyltransferase subunit F